MYKSSEEMYEVLLNDDVYLMLEEVNRWRNPEMLFSAVEGASKGIETTINPFLENNGEYLNANYKENVKIIKEFLSNIYPTESFIRKPDEYVMEKFTEITLLYQKYKKTI